MLVLFGLVACGTPPFGSGAEGSGSDGGDDGEEASDSGAPGQRVTTAGDGGGGGEGTGSDGESPEDDEGESSGPTPGDDGGGDGGSPTTSCTCAPASAFPSIWVPDADAGTVSKIDTATLATRATFATGSDGSGGPNAASVSIDGRAVAVGNRDGGVTKIWTHPSLCDDLQNTLAGVQTSTDATALPWGTDECVAWSVDIELGDQSVVAWGPGEQDPGTCEYEEQVVWVAGCPGAAGTAGAEDSRVLWLDGETGHAIGGFSFTAFPCSTSPIALGAIDGDGSLWVASTTPGHARVAEISADGNIVQVVEPPVVPAGLAVDADGYVWVSSRQGSGSATAARYDKHQMTWDVAQNVVARGESAIAQHPNGMLWTAYEGLGAGNAPGGTTIDPFQLHVGGPTPEVCAGGGCGAMSIDFEGRVWSFAEQGIVYRYDPDSASLTIMSRSDVPSVASDMTGFALQNAACDDP